MEKKLEDKKILLERIFRRCLIVSDFFIEINQRRNQSCAYSLKIKQSLVDSFEKDKTDYRLINRNISGYRATSKDLNEDVKDFLSQEEQDELKQRILDQLGPDMV